MHILKGEKLFLLLVPRQTASLLAYVVVLGFGGGMGDVVVV